MRSRFTVTDTPHFLVQSGLRSLDALFSSVELCAARAMTLDQLRQLFNGAAGRLSIPPGSLSRSKNCMTLSSNHDWPFQERTKATPACSQGERRPVYCGEVVADATPLALWDAANTRRTKGISEAAQIVSEEPTPAVAAPRTTVVSHPYHGFVRGVRGSSRQVRTSFISRLVRFLLHTCWVGQLRWRACCMKPRRRDCSLQWALVHIHRMH